MKKATSSGTAQAKSVLAVTASATLAGLAMARLEAAASAIHESEIARRERELQLLSTQAGGFQAVIRHGKTLVEIQGDSFAVRQLLCTGCTCRCNAMENTMDYRKLHIAFPTQSTDSTMPPSWLKTTG